MTEKAQGNTDEKLFIEYNNFKLKIEDLICRTYDFDCFFGRIYREITFMNANREVVFKQKDDPMRLSQTFGKPELDLVITDADTKKIENFEPELTLAEPSKVLEHDPLKDLFVLVPIPKYFSFMYSNANILSRKVNPIDDKHFILSKALLKNAKESNIESILADIRTELFALNTSTIYLTFLVDPRDVPHFYTNVYKNKTGKWLFPSLINGIVVPDYIADISDKKPFHLLYGDTESSKLNVISKYDIYRPEIAEKIYSQHYWNYNVKQMLETLL